MGAMVMSREGQFVCEITVCPPGRRSKAIVERKAIESSIRILTETALVSPEKGRLAPPAAGDRRSAQERVEAAERAEALSVALAQPHRSGCDDKMLVDPLGGFCRLSWPPRILDSGRDANEDHRNCMYRAGQMYAEIVHQHRVLLGLGSGGRTTPEGGSITLSDVELRVKCEAARIKRDDADTVLRGVFSGAVSAMMRVAVDEQPPTPYQEDMLRHSLWSLAVHFGLQKVGINSGKGVDGIKTA